MSAVIVTTQSIRRREDGLSTEVVCGQGMAAPAVGVGGAVNGKTAGAGSRAAKKIANGDFTSRTAKHKGSNVVGGKLTAHKWDPSRGPSVGRDGRPLAGDIGQGTGHRVTLKLQTLEWAMEPGAAAAIDGAGCITAPHSMLLGEVSTEDQDQAAEKEAAALFSTGGDGGGTPPLVSEIGGPNTDFRTVERLLRGLIQLLNSKAAKGEQDWAFAQLPIGTRWYNSPPTRPSLFMCDPVSLCMLRAYAKCGGGLCRGFTGALVAACPPHIRTQTSTPALAGQSYDLSHAGLRIRATSATIMSMVRISLAWLPPQPWTAVAVTVV